MLGLTLCFAALRARAIARTFFSPAWANFTFPTCTCSVATLRLAHRVSSPALLVLGGCLGVAAATVDELMARLNALLVNDTAAVGPTGTPRLSIHEMWSTGAANETMVGVLTEAFNWMEVSAETSDDDAWARLLALTNMTAADEERTLRLEDGSSMLRAAFDAVRKRRALDWKTQQARSLAPSSTPPASAATLSPFGRCSRSSLRRCASRTRCSRPTRIRRSS